MTNATMTLDKMVEALPRVFDINMENVTVTKLGKCAGWLTFWDWTEEVSDFINFCKDVAEKRFYEDGRDIFMIRGLLLYVEIDDPALYDYDDSEIFF